MIKEAMSKAMNKENLTRRGSPSGYEGDHER